MSTFAGFEMTAVGEPMRAAEREFASLEPGQVRVRVVGCGVCHTDLGFLYDGVPTRRPLPLILGHEIAGYVEDAGEAHRDLLGKAVIVPAVTPCGECPACQAGHGSICPKQVMPGNDVDGGFAERVVVPGRGLCVVPGASDDPNAPIGSVDGLTLRHLSVIADAISTPYQAIERSGLREGGLAIVVGLGGVGGYAAQIAAVRGAKVVGLDVDERKLERAESFGVSLALNPKEVAGRELKKRIKTFAKEQGVASTGWVIVECSGTAPGQTTAFELLVHGATLLVVGFTMDKISARLSNLMAFDARALGNWGCVPEHYPAVVDMVLSGKINVLDHTELRPLAEISKAFEDVHTHKVERRLIMTP